MDRKDRLFIAAVAADCRAAAEKWGLGVESDRFCTAAEMDAPDALAREEGFLSGISRRIVHGPFNELSTAAIEPRVTEITRARFAQALALAEKLGAEKLVLHTGYIPRIYYPEWYIDRSADFWRAFLSEHPSGPPIVLENVLESDPCVPLEIVRRVNDPRLRLCLDIGHANAQAAGVSPEEWVRRTAHWLSHVHLHSNDGTGDTHGPLFSGTIPMKEILSLLAELAPGATWTLETLEAETSCRFLTELGWIED
ncbi:MAG: sugar phosphate isomerase/epimerase [Clostridia bacterium]|nr:sugar phosphate isomerase/epimerase [Clostridia bacterium]